MLLKENPGRTSSRRFSLTDQARAWSVVLAEEFGTPFAFYQATANGAAPTLVWSPEGEAPRPLSAGTLQRLLTAGQPCVLPLDEGHYPLALLLCESGRPVLVAVADLPALVPHAGASSAEREQARLQKWLQAVNDRLRLTDQLSCQQHSEEEQNQQTRVCWEALFALGHLIQRLRIHKDPEKNLRRILETAFALLDVQTLVWVPQSGNASILIQGEPCLSPSDIRQLVSQLTPEVDPKAAEPFLCNDVTAQSWGQRFSQVTNLLAFQLADHGAPGWLLALNKSAPGGAGRKPFRKSDAALLMPFVALLGLHVRSFDRYRELKDLLVGLTRSLTSAIDAKDSYTYGHSERVARIAIEVGRELGLAEDELADIYLAGLLHDIGKIGIRDTVLSKREALTPEEFDHIKQHVTIGYAILADLRPIRNLLPGVLYHHERVDGTGYPDGLVGDTIPLLARVLAVADAYDAMSTSRPYREAMPCRRVEEILIQGAGTQWDQQVIDAFLRCRLKIHAIHQRGVGDSLRQALEGVLSKDGSSLQWHSNVTAS